MKLSQPLGAQREYSASDTGRMLPKPMSLMTWKATAQPSDTGWPVCATIMLAAARVSGAPAAMQMPMVILLTSSGSFLCRPYQRQNITDAPMVTKEMMPSSDTIQPTGMVLPKNTRWKLFSAHNR